MHRRSLGTLLGAAGFALACSQPVAPSGDVLLISVDTLRADHLQSYGYERPTSPRLAARFEDGAIFERAYATHASTPPSVVSILSGLYPPEHRVRQFFQLLPDATRLLPDLLGERYQSAAFVSNAVLTNEALGIARRFDHYDDLVDQRESARKVYERNAMRTTDAALGWLAAARDIERPLFLWVHYIDPHGPYRPPRDAPADFRHEGQVPMEWDRIRQYMREPGLTDALEFVDRYDEEIAYVDAAIDRLLLGYAERFDLDAALLVFTADHGEAMIEHERWFTHGYGVYEGIIRVPLMLRGPGIQRGRFSGIVSQIDIAPTVLHHVGVPQPPDMLGHALQKGASPASDRIVYAEGGEETTMLRAAIQGDEKWVARMSSGTRVPHGRAYFDLREDPAELSPRSDESLPSELLSICQLDPDPGGLPQNASRGSPLGGPKVAPRATGEDLEALRALGYVE